MRWPLIGALALSVVIPCAVARAQGFTNQFQQTSQCVLQYTGNTRSQLAIQTIQSTCSDVVNPLGLSTSARQAYDQCLLQHLNGAQSDTAAAQIISACGNLYPMR
ncbi:MAG TPA: hypothetical protein VMF67_09130 [Rhizomicrobium sp.]|nr:hypothetical protein [Rhizomicrobium sp.]